MSGEIVNLRLVRKAKARTDASTKAAANRIRFGRTKGERTAEANEAERLIKTIDGAKRDGPGVTSPR